MGKVLIGAALLAGMGLGVAGTALAQTPPGMGGPGGQGPGFPPGPPGMGMGMGMGPGMMGPGMMGRPPGPRGMMPRPPRAAVFAFNRGDTHIMIKCSDEESTRACVDAASALLDKVGAATGTSTGTTTR
jgi:hypothetical protein